MLDKTRTAMGARLLRTFTERPLIDSDEINARLTAVEELNKQAMIGMRSGSICGPCMIWNV